MSTPLHWARLRWTLIFFLLASTLLTFQALSNPSGTAHAACAVSDGRFLGSWYREHSGYWTELPDSLSIVAKSTSCSTDKAKNYKITTYRTCNTWPPTECGYGVTYGSSYYSYVTWPPTAPYATLTAVYNYPASTYKYAVVKRKLSMTLYDGYMRLTMDTTYGDGYVATTYDNYRK